jgi:hypothetical protein
MATNTNLSSNEIICKIRIDQEQKESNKITQKNSHFKNLIRNERKVESIAGLDECGIFWNIFTRFATTNLFSMSICIAVINV